MNQSDADRATAARHLAKVLAYMACGKMPDARLHAAALVAMFRRWGVLD